MNFKLSDNAKFNAIWSLLNVNYNEANDWVVEYGIVDIYDEYAVVKNYFEGIFERVYYTKSDETDSVELGERVRCYFLDVTESEKKALEALHGLNDNTYEKVDETYSSALAEVEAKTGELNTANETIETLNGEIANLNTTVETKTAEYDTLTETYNTEKSENETKIGELNESIVTLTTERDDALNQLTAAQESVNSLTNEVATLNSFKAEIEKKEKEAVVAKYAKRLSTEILEAYSAKLDEYSDARTLDKDLAYELVSTNDSVFTVDPIQSAYILKDEGAGNGIEGILAKYKK